MSELKTKPSRRSVQAFLRRLDHEGRREDCFRLLAIMEAITETRPRMWGTSLIGFGSYHYVYASGREGDWPVAGFSPRKRDLTIYIMPGFGNYQPLLKQLGPHKTGKSCLYLKRLDDVDTRVLERLIKRSVSDMEKMYPCKW